MPEERPKNYHELNHIVKNALVISKAKNVNQLFKNIPEINSLTSNAKLAAKVNDN